MKRKTFLKVASAILTGPFIAPMQAWTKNENPKNWAGNLQYSTNQLSEPTSIAKIREEVKKLAKLKALGTRHCFNPIADSNDHLMSMRGNNKVLDLNKDARQVTVEGGINYGELSPYLHENGFALHNLASLPHISVAGGCITATHGSGAKNGNLSSSVAAVEIMDAEGNLHSIHKDKNEGKFSGAVVNLGAMGIITKVTLKLLPAYQVRQYVYEHMPLQQMKDHFEEIMSAGYSVSLFTDWQSDTVNEVWIKCLEEDQTDFGAKNEFFGAKAATKNMHPIAALSAEHCSEQMGKLGPWYDRLPHFRMGFTPSSGKELQAEFFVPKHHAVEAIMAVSRLRDAIGPHLFISEIRSIAADQLWMSPCYQQDSVAIHFTWKQDWEAVRQLLPVIERELEPFDVKPHWGKLFTMEPKLLQSRYEKLEDFKKLVQEFDPKGKFRNDFLAKNLYGN